MYQPTLQDVKSILCLGAHADDIEIGCGGTILTLLDHNPSVDVHWIVFSGERRRAAEAQQSAERFLQCCTGRRDIRLQEFRDSYFPAQWERIKDCFHQLSCQIQPDVIFTHRRDDLHQDHRVLSELSWCAFRNHLLLEYEIPKYEGDLGCPNLFIPIDRNRARDKSLLLLDSFSSQLDKPWFSEDTFQALLRLRGLEANSPSGYAEAFHCRKMCLLPGQHGLASGQFDRQSQNLARRPVECPEQPAAEATHHPHDPSGLHRSSQPS